MPIKLLLVDSHAIVRLGCISALSQALAPLDIREAASGEDALIQVQQSIPHLLLMDFYLPGISGLETTRRLRQRLPGLHVLFFAEASEATLVRKALAAGACGWLCKTTEPQRLVEAVKRTLAGQVYIEPELAMQMAGSRGDTSASDRRLATMTARELEVFILLARGIAQQQIAERLCISRKTLSNHICLLKNKLGIDSLAALVHLALQTGVLRDTASA